MKLTLGHFVCGMNITKVRTKKAGGKISALCTPVEEHERDLPDISLRPPAISMFVMKDRLTGCFASPINCSTSL